MAQVVLLPAEWEFYGGASFTFSGAWMPRTGHVVDGASGRSGHGSIFRCWGVRFKIIPKHFWPTGRISRKLGGSFAEGKGWFERAIPIQSYSNTRGAHPETIRKANTVNQNTPKQRKMMLRQWPRKQLQQNYATKSRMRSRWRKGLGLLEACGSCVCVGTAAVQMFFLWSSWNRTWRQWRRGYCIPDYITPEKIFKEHN